MASSENSNMEADRLSLLPAEIQHRILSNVPTHEAFKTSLVSRMWSALWPSLPVLIFDYRVFPEVQDKLSTFLGFVRRTLAHHDETSLETFSLYFCPTRDCDALIQSEWVTFAVEHNARKITLCGKLEKEQKIPDSLFTCRSIVSLTLSVPNVALEWPMSAALSSLKKLILLNMSLSGNCTMDLSLICPQLESLYIFFCDLSAFTKFSITSSTLKILDMSHCPGSESCEIKMLTPALETLIYVGAVAQDYAFMPMDSLSMAGVMIRRTYPAQARDACHLSAVKLARGVRSSRRVLFNDLFIEFIKDENPSSLWGDMLFDKLETVILRMWPTRDHLLTLFVLLSRCPQLSFLDIDIARPLEPTHSRPNQAKFEIPLMLNRLQSVKIEEFGGDESEMEIVKVFLQNCPMLRELKIKMTRESNDSGPETRQLPAKIGEMLQLAKSSSVTVSFS